MKAFFKEFAHKINNSESGRISTVAARYLINEKRGKCITQLFYHGS